MKKNRLLFGGLAIAAVIALGSCSTNKQITYRDDVYNNQSKAQRVYQSPDYYYTDGDQYAQDDSYYSDEYSDDEYNNGGYDDMGELEYANRINRFYYSSPGMSYYDPWFDPWYGYSGFGLGLGWGWGGGMVTWLWLGWWFRLGRRLRLGWLPLLRIRLSRIRMGQLLGI